MRTLSKKDIYTLAALAESDAASLSVAVASYEQDTSVLNVKMADGAEYCVDNAGHARTIHLHIRKFSRISASQRIWLERYRRPPREEPRERLRALLKTLRLQLKAEMKR